MAKAKQKTIHSLDHIALRLSRCVIKGFNHLVLHNRSCTLKTSSKSRDLDIRCPFCYENIYAIIQSATHVTLAQCRYRSRESVKVHINHQSRGNISGSAKQPLMGT